eukprot:scaffold3443_cov404-Prasinococcus_capsulatus_cf.AAC.15
MDNCQPSGSFKLRGIGLACQRAKEKGYTKLVSSSATWAATLAFHSSLACAGGNAGLAVAYAGRALKMQTTVVLPETTPAFVSSLLQGYGAEVIVHGSMWALANEKAMELAEESNGVLMHPFEGQDMWEGHASLVHELQRELPEKPDAIVASVGGGGLVLGILEGTVLTATNGCSGLKEVGWDDVKVVACETEGANSFAQSAEAGKLIELPGITSVAKSLGASKVSPTLMERYLELGPQLLVPWVGSDRDAVSACARFADEHRVLVEPACGISLAAAYNACEALRGCQRVVIEVCGGAIVTRALMSEWCTTLGC